MTKKNYLPVYTLSEELINSISHGVGTCLSIAALVLCIVQAAVNGTAAGGGYELVGGCLEPGDLPVGPGVDADVDQQVEAPNPRP